MQVTNNTSVRCSSKQQQRLAQRNNEKTPQHSEDAAIGRTSSAQPQPIQQTGNNDLNASRVT